VKLEGNIAVLANGGGLGLASQDVISSAGGKCGAMVDIPDNQIHAQV
jgi:succinyl-CoA synthetase beta subunit